MNTPYIVGAGPVIRALCEEIGLVATIDQCVRWDPVRCHSPGERILALVINVLTARQPLYRVHEPLALTDTPLLLGAGICQLPDTQHHQISDKLAWLLH